DRGDVWMIQRRKDLGFALESCYPIGIAFECCRQDFGCNVAPEVRGFCLIYLSHAACSQVGGDGVVSELGSDHQVGPSGHILLEVRTGCSVWPEKIKAA